MNPLGNGNIGGLSPQLMQNIQQVKQMMSMAQNPNLLLQQNPMLNQIMQAYRGQNPRQVFETLARQKGVDPEAIIRELQS